MEDHKKPSWRWKHADSAANSDLNLLYEPGNWGDILKGAWAALAARSLIRSRGLAALEYLDPFAGAPTYPLSAPSIARLRSQPLRWLADIVEPFVQAGRFPSTARIVAETARLAGARAYLSVFDLDASRLAAWNEVDGASILSARGAEEIIEGLARAPRRPDLLLVDPYDLLDRRAMLLPACLDAAKGCLVLLYLYNKSPRGGGFARAHASFRNALASGVGGAASLLGRVASDAVLPRAWHEVVLVGPPDLVAPLVGPLAAATRDLAGHIAALGAVEPIGGASGLVTK